MLQPTIQLTGVQADAVSMPHFQSCKHTTMLEAAIFETAYPVCLEDSQQWV